MGCAVATEPIRVAAKPGASSAEKPGIFAKCNIGWQSWRLNNLPKRELVLKKDLLVALEAKSADVVMPCECGEIGTGLGPAWEDVSRRCCGSSFLVTHQSHYTCIIRDDTVEVLRQPTLQGPLASEKCFRMCQHLCVQLRQCCSKAYRPLQRAFSVLT